MVDLARIAGLSQLSPQGFLGSGFGSMNQPQTQQFDFSQYEPGFRDYVQKNNLSGGGKMMMTLPGGLGLYNTGEIDAFSDYMNSIGAGDYYNQYNQSLSGGLVTGFGTPTPAPAPVAASTRAPVMQTPTPAPVMQTPTPAPVAQTPLPITQPSVNVQNTGDMKMAKPDGVTETITRTAPAPFAEPFLQYGMSEALRQYQQGPYQYYPGETVVGFAPQTEQALRMQEQMALAGSPVGTAAQQYATDVLGGTFLGGSPMLSEAINRALDPVQARTTSALAQRGRLGSGAAADVMTRALGNVAADIAFRDYGAERARQQDVLRMAPALQQASYFDVGQLAGVGAARENLAQQQLASDIARFQFEQQAPAQALGQYQALVSGFPMGGTSSAIQPYFDDPTGAKFLSGAALGASLIGDEAGFNMPTLIAAGLGGLLGTA